MKRKWSGECEHFPSEKWCVDIRAKCVVMCCLLFSLDIFSRSSAAVLVVWQPPSKLLTLGPRLRQHIIWKCIAMNMYEFQIMRLFWTCETYWNMTCVESEVIWSEKWFEVIWSDRQSDRHYDCVKAMWAGRRRWLCETIACWNHLGTSDEFLNAEDASKCLQPSSNIFKHLQP